jgi:hypothetical protein
MWAGHFEGEGEGRERIGPWNEEVWNDANKIKNLMRPIVKTILKYEAVDANISTMVPDMVML